LAINRMGPNPSWGSNWDPKSSIKNWLSVNYTQQNRQNRSFSQGARPETKRSYKRHIKNVDGKGVAGNYFCKMEKTMGYECCWTSS
jgi:hypothetical protein